MIGTVPAYSAWLARTSCQHRSPIIQHPSPTNEPTCLTPQSPRALDVNQSFEKQNLIKPRIRSKQSFILYPSLSCNSTMNPIDPPPSRQAMSPADERCDNNSDSDDGTPFDKQMSLVSLMARAHKERRRKNWQEFIRANSSMTSSSSDGVSADRNDSKMIRSIVNSSMQLLAPFNDDNDQGESGTMEDKHWMRLNELAQQ